MNTRIARWVVATCLLTGATVASGEAQAKVDRSAEEAALRAADLAWSAAAGRKDLDATVAFMADDGATLAPNEPAARDKAAVRKGWANLLGLRDVAIAWKPLRVQVSESGELGFTSGSYTLSWTDDKGKRIDDRGKYLEVWKKVDGQWKCLEDAYSSDLPLE